MQELQGRFWDAILAGDVARVSALLDEGAEISTRLGAEDWGKHPLHAAAASSNMEVVQLLLARGASPNMLDYASDPPLWHAVEHGLVDMVLLLLDNKSMSSDLNHKSSNEVVVVKPKEGKVCILHACAGI